MCDEGGGPLATPGGGDADYMPAFIRSFSTAACSRHASPPACWLPHQLPPRAPPRAQDPPPPPLSPPRARTSRSCICRSAAAAAAASANSTCANRLPKCLMH